jgi:hypothetical protein
LLSAALGAMGTADNLLGLDQNGISSFEETVRRSIAKIANPAKDLIPEDMPHRLMARWLAKTSRQFPVEVFTLNYDILLRWLWKLNGFRCLTDS